MASVRGDSYNDYERIVKSEELVLLVCRLHAESSGPVARVLAAMISRSGSCHVVHQAWKVISDGAGCVPHSVNRLRIAVNLCRQILSPSNLGQLPNSHLMNSNSEMASAVARPYTSNLVIYDLLNRATEGNMDHVLQTIASRFKSALGPRFLQLGSLGVLLYGIVLFSKDHELSLGEAVRSNIPVANLSGRYNFCNMAQRSHVTSCLSASLAAAKQATKSYISQYLIQVY